MEAAPQEAQLAQQALKYVETAQPDWNLEPSEVEVTQPENQDQMLQALDSMAQEEGGDLLARRQDANVAAARRSSENPNGGFTRLNLEAGFNLHDHIEPGMDRQAYYQLRNESDPTVEYVDTPDEHNLLFTGMLEATGAQPLRDDLAEGNETGSRIYKGMIDGKPVYFEEHVGPVTITEDGETKNKYARSVIVLSEASARTALNELSENEQAAMEELGYEQPIIGDPNYDQAIKPTRSNMRELVEQKAPDVPDTTEQPSAPTEQAEAEQPALATTEAPTEKDLRESFHGVKESTEFDRGMQAKMAEKARPEQVAESKAVLEQHGINADLIDPAAAP